MIIRFTVPLVLALTAQSLFAASGDDLAVIEQPTEVPTISPIATVNIEVEKKWELYLRGRASASEPPLLIGVGLPPGAVMTEAEEGWYLISWRPKNSDVGPHVLTVRAMDPQDPNKQFDRDISVDVHSDAGDLDKPTELAAAKPASTLVASSDLGDSETNIKTRPLTSKSSYIDITSSDRAESHEIRGLNKRKQSESNLNSGQEVKSNASELIAPTLKPITTHILSAGRVLAIQPHVLLANQ